MSEDKKLTRKFWNDPPNNATDKEADAQIEKYKASRGIFENAEHAPAAQDHAEQN